MPLKKLAPWLRSSSHYDPVVEARRAFEAYGEHAGWTNVRGEQMPSWAGVGDTIRGHWIAAIHAVLGTESADANG